MDKEQGGMNQQASWPIQSLGWLVIGAWFSASLISQVLYMATYGVPYGPEMLIAKLGPIYWLVGGIELLFWVFMGKFFFKKFKRIDKSPTPQSPIV